MSLRIRKFQSVTDILKPFDCGNADLNGFLIQTSDDSPNASMYAKELLAETYVVEDGTTHVILAYFSILNDKIERDLADKQSWNRLSRRIPNAKRRSSYPGLKIGRLAVSKDCQGTGLGHKIVNFIQLLFFTNRIAGCRFLTVDALKPAEDFYRKCQFLPLSASSSDNDTVLMFFDLKGITLPSPVLI